MITRMSYYNLETGALAGYMGSTLADIEANRPLGCGLVPDLWDYESHYVDPVTFPGFPGEVWPLVLERPEMEPTVTGRLIQNLPQPCTVSVAGQTHSVTDGEIEIDSDLPGTYKVRVESFPYIPMEIEVTA